MAPFKHPRTHRPHLRTVSITGVGSYVPERILTNAELERMVETSDEWITTRTGIRERRIAAAGETTSDMAVAAARHAITRAGITPEQIDLIIPHQANMRINEMVRSQLGLPSEKVFNNIQKYGNTTAATIPICMSEAVAEGKLKQGDLVLTLAFGAGFTWGGNLIRW